MATKLPSKPSDSPAWADAYRLRHARRWTSRSSPAGPRHLVETSRTQPQCDWLTAKIGAERLIELTANPALPNFTLHRETPLGPRSPAWKSSRASPTSSAPRITSAFAFTGTLAMDMQGSLRHPAARRRPPPLRSHEVAEAAAGIPHLLASTALRRPGNLRPHQRRRFLGDRAG